MKEMNPNQHHDPIYAVWQAEVQAAGKRPWLASILLQKGRAVYRRFVHYYLALQSLSRRARRQLLQKFAVGLGGLALAMAINGGPVLANNIAVTTTMHGINADGECSLVEAIITANDTVDGDPFGADCANGDFTGPDTIQLSGNTYLVDYAFAAVYDPTGLPNVTSEITIEGNGATIQAVQPGSRGEGLPLTPFRIMSVGEGGNLTLDNATLTGGYAYSSSFPGGGGGAIYGYNAAVTITNTAVITGNQAAGTGGGIALYSSDTLSNLTITDSTISGNTAIVGGGISNLSYEEAANVTVNNSVISGNTAYILGGGILNVGYTSGSVIIENSSQIDNNSAYLALGGGIANISFYRADVTVQGRSVISGNEAGIATLPPSQTPAGGTIPSTLGSGGGIFNTNSSLLLAPVPEGGESNPASTILSTRLTQWGSERLTAQQNIARGDGALYAATVHINDSTVTGNSANGSGGGVTNMGYGLSGLYVENNAVVTNNTAVISSEVPGTLPPHGGGLYNSALGCEECPPLPPEPSETPAGALPPFGHTAILTVDNSTVSGNTAVGNGGGIYNYASGQAVVNVVNNATISDNSAYGLPLPAETSLAHKRNGRHQPASITGSEPPLITFGLGGGIFNDSYYGGIPEPIPSDEAQNRVAGTPPSYSQVLVSDSTISGNTAQAGGGGVANHSYGAAYSSISNNARITDNSSVDGTGGGISTYGYYGAAITDISESTISGNQASDEGGGVDNYSYYGYAGTFIDKSTISGNSAGYGGGFYNGSYDATSNATVNNSTISGNSATGHGGGFDSHSGMVALTHTTVTNNSAPEGGGIYATDSINLYNSIVAGNPVGGDCDGPITSGGYNLDSDGTCVTDGVNNDLTVADPLLGPLQVNAPGTTATHALLAGSPAIDAIPLDADACGVLADDQRGVARPQGEGCDIGAVEWQAYLAFLPIVAKDGVPDLIITNLDVSGGSVQVTIRNQGTRTVTEDFWVDLYLNPNPAPMAVNEVWDLLGLYGAAWGVTADIAPGAELTLTLNDSYYDPTESNMPSVIPPGTVTYAQVDAAHINTTYGAVLEDHEINNGAYNNISGPQTTSTAITTRIMNYVSGVFRNKN